MVKIYLILCKEKKLVKIFAANGPVLFVSLGTKRTGPNEEKCLLLFFNQCSKITIKELISRKEKQWGKNGNTMKTKISKKN